MFHLLVYDHIKMDGNDANTPIEEEKALENI